MKCIYIPGVLEYEKGEGPLQTFQKNRDLFVKFIQVVADTLTRAVKQIWDKVKGYTQEKTRERKEKNRVKIPSPPRIPRREKYFESQVTDNRTKHVYARSNC